MPSTLHELNVIAHRQVTRWVKGSTNDFNAEASQLLIGAHQKVLAFIESGRTDFDTLTEAYTTVGVQQGIALGIADNALEDLKTFKSLFDSESS